MIVLVLIYLLFQIGFDHWGDNSVTWKVVYFAFQYGWVSSVCLFQLFNSKDRVRLLYFFLALIFSVLAVSELAYIGTDTETYSMMSSAPPAFALTSMAVILFVLYEIIQRWKNR